MSILTRLSRLWNRALLRTPHVGPGVFLVWEPCSKNHGEVVPGYVHYLRELGYEVSVLVSPGRLKEGLFCRMQDPGVHLNRLSQAQIRRFLRHGDYAQCAGLLVTTARKLPHTAAGAADLEQVFGPRLQVPVHLVEHDVRPKVDRGLWDPRSLTLRRVDYRGAGSCVVNPHHFGEVRITAKTPGRTRFLLVGTAGARRRAMHLIVDGVRRLLAEGVRDFEVVLVGKRSDAGLPSELRPWFRGLGRIDFARLYDEVEAADFILTAYQSDNPDHLFYRTAGTSGNFQLVYGFRKPCVLLREFAAIQDLDDCNSVLYDRTEDLGEGMLRAARLSVQDYADMQARLDATARDLGESSIANLRGLLAGNSGAG